MPSIAPATPPVPPVIMGARNKLAEVVAEIGLDGVLDYARGDRKSRGLKTAFRSTGAARANAGGFFHGGDQCVVTEEHRRGS